MEPQKLKQNQAQFEHLLKGLLPVIYALALRLTRDRDTAEDLIAQTLMKAWQHFPKLHDKTKFKAWILKIATNTYISAYRRQKIRPEIAMSELESKVPEGKEFSLFDQLCSPFGLWQYNPEKIFLDKLAAQDIHHAIDSLPDVYRLVFVLCCVQELSYQAAADILNIKVGTVRSRLHRAKTLLQKSLWHLSQKKK